MKVCGIAGSLRRREARKKFTEDGALSDEPTQKFLRAHLERLLAWVEGMPKR